MVLFPRKCGLLLVLAVLALPASVNAQPPPQQGVSATSAAPKRGPPQGVAVIASGATRDDAVALARAVYGSSLRPRSLDELRARILVGDPAPPAGSKEIHELAELRASIKGDDAATRRLLLSIAQQLNVEALLVVSRGTLHTPADPTDPGDLDGGTGDAGAAAQSSPTLTARLFLVETGDFDAARYEPDTGPNAWRGTVSSISPRFPPPPQPAAAHLQGAPPKLSSEGSNKPFYTSPWLWGAIGAAALIGGFFYFAAQDTSSDPIHLQMRVPR